MIRLPSRINFSALLTSKALFDMAMQTLVLGVGDAGQAALLEIAKAKLTNARLIAINTYAEQPPETSIIESIHLGGSGFGAGGNPEIAAKVVQDNHAQIVGLLDSKPNRVYLIAGLGGGTGTGMLPVIANIVHKTNIAVYAIVSLPFAFEGQQRKQIAERGLSALTSSHIQDVIVVKGDVMASRLLSKTPEISDTMQRLSQSLSWHLLAHLTG
ncbi:MAG: hypothetical protein CL607_19000 [Anaerolineaceae bacterium]|nr:hypothetical protein [Anaerolineaceae bacterium]